VLIVLKSSTSFFFYKCLRMSIIDSWNLIGINFQFQYQNFLKNLLASVWTAVTWSLVDVSKFSFSNNLAWQISCCTLSELVWCVPQSLRSIKNHCTNLNPVWPEGIPAVSLCPLVDWICVKYSKFVSVVGLISIVHSRQNFRIFLESYS